MAGRATTESSGRLDKRIAGEQQVLAQPLRALIKRPAVVCEPQRTLAEVAALMREQGVGSVVIVGEGGKPVGVVTTHDLVRVVAERLEQRPVSGAMTRDPVALPAHAFAYEAAMAMTEHGIRHVLVTENGRLLGVVSARDLFAIQRLALGELTMEIRSASAVDTLAGIAVEIRRLGALLVAQGVSPEPLMSFVSVLNDRLTQRVIEVVRKRHDLGRIRWCWIAFGSEGRFEQTFSTDQDNGLLFELHDGSPAAAARERLLPFTREVNEALDACGFPLCRGNVMASNPELCLTLEEWKAKMAGWVEVSLPKALLEAAICFDFRPLYGDAALTASLRDWIGPRMRANPAFLRRLAEAALEARPALGRLGGFATEDAPGAAHSINLKLHGARIFVDAARVLALSHGAAETSTIGRLRAVRAATGAREGETEAMVHAFCFVQSMRLRVQAGLAEPARAQEARSAAEDAHNRLDPDTLDAFEQASLKEAMRLARELQSRLALDFQL